VVSVVLSLLPPLCTLSLHDALPISFWIYRGCSGVPRLAAERLAGGSPEVFSSNVVRHKSHGTDYTAGDFPQSAFAEPPESASGWLKSLLPNRRNGFCLEVAGLGKPGFTGL